jgi:hypothetical protein
MTEDEWLACNDPHLMLQFLRGKASSRKMRLFTVACCKRIWPLLPDARSRKAVEVAAEFADGLLSINDLHEASRNAALVATDPACAFAPPDSPLHAIEHARIAVSMTSADPINNMFTLAGHVARYCSNCAAYLRLEKGRADELGRCETNKRLEVKVHLWLLRDLFGPLPFRPVTLPISVITWNDRIVPKIATGIYAERAFGRLPILHDALLDAGCDDEELLSHCRYPEGHVRGCWALDLLLGKE